MFRLTSQLFLPYQGHGLSRGWPDVKQEPRIGTFEVPLSSIRCAIFWPVSLNSRYLLYIPPLFWIRFLHVVKIVWRPVPLLNGGRL